MNISRLASRLLTALVLACGVASASTIMATAVDTTRGGTMVIREYTADLTSFTDSNALAGVILITLTDGGQVNRDTLCVDLFTYIYLGVTYNTNVLRPADVPGKNLERASWLVDNYLYPAQNATLAQQTDPNRNPNWVLSPLQGMGIQFAIWDIVHDGGDGFTAGRVQKGKDTIFGVTDPKVVTWAQTYEDASLGKSNNQAFVYNNVDGSGTPAQMLIGPQFFDGGPQPVPEPETLMPMGIALIALSFGLRRGIRRRQ